MPKKVCGGSLGLVSAGKTSLEVSAALDGAGRGCIITGLVAILNEGETIDDIAASTQLEFSRAKGEILDVITPKGKPNGQRFFVVKWDELDDDRLPITARIPRPNCIVKEIEFSRPKNDVATTKALNNAEATSQLGRVTSSFNQAIIKDAVTEALAKDEHLAYLRNKLDEMTSNHRWKRSRSPEHIVVSEPLNRESLACRSRSRERISVLPLLEEIEHSVDPMLHGTATMDDVIGCLCLGCADFRCVAWTLLTPHERKVRRGAFINALAGTGTVEGARWQAFHFGAPGPLKHKDGANCSEEQKRGKLMLITVNKKKVWVNRCMNWRCKNIAVLGVRHLPQHNIAAHVRYFVRMGTLNRPLSSLGDEDPEIPARCDWWMDLAEAALVYSLTCLTDADRPDWEEMEWDETFFGVRKFHAGHRTRAGGTMTFVGGVRVQKCPLTGKKVVLGGLMAGVANKSAANSLPIIKTLMAENGTLETDGARMYRTAADYANVVHHFVNHSHCFVADDLRRTHTNSIEGYWRLVKSLCRTWWPRQSSDDVQVATNFQLASVAVNFRLAGIDPAAGFMTLLRWRMLRTRTKAQRDLWELLVNQAKDIFTAKKDHFETQLRDARAHGLETEEIENDESIVAELLATDLMEKRVKEAEADAQREARADAAAAP